jgi:DNA-binding NarL/FixJ family response regulator
MDVLIIEDFSQFGLLVKRELEERHGYDVTYAVDPLTVDPARSHDVVLVDLLYQHLVHSFEQRMRNGQVNLEDRSFLTSGLAVLEAMRERPQGVPVIWSSGEASRVLHLIMAHQSFGVRAYCSKGGPMNEVGVADVVEAIKAASRGESWTDRQFSLYLPSPGLQHIGDLLFTTPRRSRIWRALALGASSHREIARLTGYSQKTSRNEMSTSDMMERLALLDPGIDPSAPPLPTLAGYASRNWPFFLDDTVVRLYPHG